VLCRPWDLGKGAGMLYAMLLLGLIPAVLLPDFMAESDDEIEDNMLNAGSVEAPVNLLEDPTNLPSGEPLDPAIEDDDAWEADELEEAARTPEIEDDLPNADMAELDPVIEDDLPPVDPPTELGRVLSPVIEDDSDQGYPDPDAAAILSPVIEDDIAFDGTRETPLPPIIEDDLANQESDEASLRPVEDITDGDTAAWLNASDLESGSYAEISGFEVGTDILGISLDPDHDLPDLSVTIRASHDGADSEVLIGDKLMAVLVGVADVPAEDIILAIQELY
jgi:hypothetical protein